MIELKSSYIFLSNPFSKNKEKTVDENGSMHIVIKKPITSFIISLFNVTKINLNEWILEQKYNSQIEVNGISYDVIFTINVVQSNTFLDVAVKGKNRVQIIKCHEYIQSIIQNSTIEEDYIMIISYDAVSEYYCNKIYPKLNELERNLRKLLFNIYVVNFGTEYYKKTVSPELQSKAKGIIKARGNEETKEIKRLQMFFYSLEFCDVQNLLFTPTWNDYDEDYKQEFLNKHQDLSYLSDDELRTAFSQFTPKSDWERFFSDKADITIVKELIESVRLSRNNIAHCKFLSHSEYIICNKAIKQLNEEILSAITVTADKDFLEKNTEGIGKTLNSIADKFKELQMSITKAIQPMNYPNPMIRIPEKLVNMSIEYSNLIKNCDFSKLFRDLNINFTESEISNNSFKIKDDE